MNVSFEIVSLNTVRRGIRLSLLCGYFRCDVSEQIELTQRKYKLAATQRAEPPLTQFTKWKFNRLYLARLFGITARRT